MIRYQLYQFYHPSTASLDYIDILSRSVTAQSNAGALNSVAVTRH